METTAPSPVPATPSTALSDALQEAARLDALRRHAAAAALLDEALERHKDASGTLRFQALVLRADLAVSLNDLIAGRGILAEARQIRLTEEERERTTTDRNRADDLETFFTHRGCAG
jgi:hypothetical protein